MGTSSTRPWIKIDVGLLDDEGFAVMPPELRGVWLTAYLIVARDGDSCKDRARLTWLLMRDGSPGAADEVAALDAAGWIEDLPNGRITIRNFDKYQLVYRGPSDLPESVAARNSRRPTTRAGRSTRSTPSGSTEDRRGENTSPAAPRSAGAPAGVREDDPAPSSEEANRIFKDLAKRGVIRAPRILGQPKSSV